MKHKFLKALSIIAGAVLSITSLAMSISAQAEDENDIIISSVIRSDVADNQVTLSNDDLLLGYISSELCNAKPAHALGTRNLTGKALDIYNYMYAEIEKIANGSSSSTSLSYPETLTWDYSDLGMTDTYDSELFKAELTNIFRSVHNYLLSDCPYELYWYNKTAGVGLSYSGLTYSDAVKQVSISKFVMNFSPAPDYKDSADYTVNTTITKSAAASAAKATSIVKTHASKDDIAKLTAYKEEICDLVTYDTNAANSNVATVGIDPWQLIHVFDGDSSTNVVCEGYSKAFQYLCNLSSFSGNVYCYNVSGTMAYNSNGENHMWNIVTINKVNYLIDVTNCDGNYIGAADKLFLKGFTGSVENGYSKNINGCPVIYKYNDSIKTYYNRNILVLCPNDYSPDNTPDPNYDSDDKPMGGDSDSGLVIWAGGNKDHKTLTITTDISATNWTNAKGKSVKGKLTWVSSKTNTDPAFDSIKHKLTTKSDKTIATVSSKGKVTAKSGGASGEQKAYIYATDSGSMTSKLYSVTVKNAAASLLCFDSPEKLDKKDKLKAVTTYSGAAAAKIYIVPSSKLGEVSDDCTYTVTAKKNNNVITLGDVKTDSNGRLYFEVTPIKPEKEGKISKITVTVTCDQSGKKTSFKVNVGAPISSVTASTTAKSIKLKKDTAELKLDLTVSGTATTTTDKLQVVVSASEPTLDSTGKKLTVTKSKQISAKLKNGIISLKASKDVTEASSVYLITTDASLKTKKVYKIMDIAADGTLSAPTAATE